MKTVVEVFFVEIHEDLARWHCKRLALDAQGHAAQADLPGLACGMPQTPDQAVQALVQAWHADAGDGMPEYLAHSTSWRFEPPDTVVLSYVVCLPEAWQHRQGGGGHIVWQHIRLRELQLAPSAAAGAPCALRIEESHVLSHALRHLAFLIHGPGADGVVSQRLTQQAKCFLSHVMPTLAGQLRR